jgi:hypothetical protein
MSDVVRFRHTFGSLDEHPDGEFVYFAALDAERTAHAKEVADLQTELENESANTAMYQFNAEAFEKEVADLREQLAKAREVLKWYGDEKNYEKSDIRISEDRLENIAGINAGPIPILQDAGQRARARASLEKK